MTWEQIELFEKWMPVVGYEGLYEVSNWGRVRSLARALPHPRSKIGATYLKPGRVLVQTMSRNGYLSLSLVPKEGSKKTHHVAPLVAAAFIGSRPPGKQIDHIDGDKRNNSVLNLHYVTPAENLTADNHTRRIPHGEKHWNVKLSNDDVNEIRRLHLEGMTQREISKLFHVAHGTISKIIRGERRMSK